MLDDRERYSMSSTVCDEGVWSSKEGISVRGKIDGWLAVRMQERKRG